VQNHTSHSAIPFFILQLDHAFISNTFDISSEVKFQYIQLSNMVLAGRLIISWFGNNIFYAINNVFDEEKIRMKR